jgi:hypothetical protein
LNVYLVIDPEMRKSVIEESLLMFELGDHVSVERCLEVEPDGLDVDDVVGHLQDNVRIFTQNKEIELSLVR